MIKSMTGFGKGEGGGFVVEMRSVNHKYLDLSIKLPRGLTQLEARVKKAVSERFSRGRLDVYITRAGGDDGLKVLNLDREAAKNYIAVLTELKDSFGLPGEVDLTLVAGCPDIARAEEEALDIESAWSDLTLALSECMDAIEGMRADEGAALADDIRMRAGWVLTSLGEIEQKAPEVVKEYALKLKERVSRLTDGMELDPARLAQEVALLADRADITEELVRAKTHLDRLEKILAEGGAVGRKMDFLIQELNREVNTIGSKSSDPSISHRVVEIKAEFEKVREQVQNIE